MSEEDRTRVVHKTLVFPVVWGPDDLDYSMLIWHLWEFIPDLCEQIAIAWTEFKVPTGVKLLFEDDDGNGNGNDEPVPLYRVAITAWELNVREGPGIGYPIHFTIMKDEVWPIYEEKDEWGRIEPFVQRWISLYWTEKL